MSSLDKLIASLSRELAVLEHARAILDTRRRHRAVASLNGKLSQASRLRNAAAATRKPPTKQKPLSPGAYAYLAALREGAKTSSELTSVVKFPGQVLGRLTAYGFIGRKGRGKTKAFQITEKGTRALAAAPAE